MNLRAVKRALKSMPAKLDDIYDQALERIKQQPSATLAIHALTWIVYAVRPLQAQEIQHAIAIDELDDDDCYVCEDMLTPLGLIVNACAGIVKLDEKSHIIGLVHKTTQEYFDRKGAEHFPDAQHYLGQGCITYLSLDVYNDGPCITDEKFEHRLRKHALLNYAARHLGSHICGDAAKKVQGPALTFLLNKPKVLCAAQVMFIAEREWRPTDYSQEFPRNFFGIHYAAYLGLTEIMWCLIKNLEVDVDSKDDYYKTPLSWAAWKGHEAVVKLLLACKVDVDSKDDDNRTPLSWAAWEGHEAVVKLLLACKVDVDSKDDYYNTPLSLAAWKGHEAVVKLLLACKVDVDSKDDDNRTPLSWAAWKGHEAVVKLLLATGKVDVDSKDDYYKTPLSLAAWKGHEAVVKLLLATGKVDVDSKDDDNRTPLSWAAWKGHEAVVKLLQSHSL
jgi:ankyrin repeat protein